MINSNNNSNVIITNMPISGPTFRAYNQDGNISGQPYWNLDIPTAGIQPGSSYKFVDRIRYYSSARTELPSPTFTFSLYSGSPTLTTGCAIPNQTILTLYAQNNSHAAFYNSTYKDPNYNVSICYNDLFGHQYTGANPWECNRTNIQYNRPESNNHVLFLNSLTNSHVSFDGVGLSYPIEVCYGDLSCNWAFLNCPANTTDIMSMSFMTNAHIGAPGYYSYQVCCKAAAPVIIIPAVKNITEARFVNGTDKSLIVNVSDGGGFGKKFDINLYGKTDYLTGESLLPSLINSNNSQWVWDHANLSVESDGVALGLTQFNFYSTPALNTSFHIGDWVYFNLSYNHSQPGEIVRKSYIAQILNETDFVPYVTTDCTQFNNTNQSICETHMLNATNNVIAWAPINASCDGNIINRCSWDNSTKSCGVKEEVYKRDVFQGSCVTAYDSINNTCVNGYRTAKVTVTSVAGQCSPAQLCDQSQYIQIPCREVALLPFFSTTNLIIVLVIIALIYLYLMSKRNNKIKRKK
ncbi:MAG: hypothetical protein WCK29_01215 [archaeon]